MPSSLHTKSLAAHIAGLHAALLDTENNNARETLALLQCDPTAQIMSFMPSQERRRCLSAVCPQLRLDSEMMVDEINSDFSQTMSRVSIRPFIVSDALTDTVLFYRILADIKDPSRQQMMLSLWWASRCGLPVELIMDNHDSAVLARLGSTLRSRVKRLPVDMCSSAAGSTDAATVSSSAPCVTALTSILSFPNLQSLSILVRGRRVDKVAAVEVPRALMTAANLPIEALRLDGWTSLRSLLTLPGSQSLRSLTVSKSKLQSLEGLCNYPMLETLALSDCPDITSLAALASLPRLRAVEVRRCWLRSLDGLDRCLALQAIDVSCNRTLSSLSALASTPLLQTIVARHCGIHSVQGLGSCKELTVVILSGNSGLDSLGDLSIAPCLQVVEATECGLLDLGAGGMWPALKEMDVNYNYNLQSVSSLHGAAKLQKIVAHNCSIRSIEGLGSCKALTTVDLHDNRNLRSLADLSKAPSVEIVLASRCHLLDLGEPGSWPALREIDLSYNTNLRSLSSLSGAPLLREVHAVGCNIQDLRVLETCPNLRTVKKNHVGDSDDELMDWTLTQLWFIAAGNYSRWRSFFL